MPQAVNGHFHTPFSFSAFTEIEQVFKMAKAEGISVLGINDFYTMDGYPEFTALAVQYRIFPLYNIEFMALQKDLQAAGVRVNDPNNPGRTYFSGKGLKFPVALSAPMLTLLTQVQVESNRQTATMIDKLNTWLSETGIDIEFSFDGIRKKYAKNMVRERHIAKALRQAITEQYPTEAAQQAAWTKIFGGKAPKSPLTEAAALENEIRGNLLKSGGKAFVPEDDKAFLSLEQVIALIIDAGGIPCYPVLLDNAKGELTDYEADYESLYRNLTAKKVFSLELIPGRNKPEIMEAFVNFFHEKGFVITFGTEHNTPQLDPVTVFGGDSKPLSPAMKRIGYEGSCVIAAHEYLIAQDKEGYLTADGAAKTADRNDFVRLGDAVIRTFVQR
jgi:predicted metal-dependent phosphoesterase TrpH